MFPAITERQAAGLSYQDRAIEQRGSGYYETGVFVSPNGGLVPYLIEDNRATGTLQEVEDPDFISLSLKSPDRVLTPHPAPSLKPDTDAAPSGKGKHTVTAINPETENRKKPELVTGVAFASRVRAASDPRARAEDMPSEYQTGTDIGGNQGEDGGTITIAGGTVYAKGYFSPAGDGIDHHNPGVGIGGGTKSSGEL